MIENLIKKLVETYSSFDNVISIYLYGSVLRNDFKPAESDIDILIFLKDTDNKISMYKTFKDLTAKLPYDIDLNIIFESEFNMRVHPGWSRHFFFDIKHSSKLILGADIIKTFNDDELTFNEAYRRLTELTQRLRFVFLNKGKTEEVDFWLKKYSKWLGISSMEFLALSGTNVFEPNKAFQMFCNFINYDSPLSSDSFTDIKKVLDFLEYATQWLFMNKYLFDKKNYDTVIFDLGQTLMDSESVLKSIDEEFNLPLWSERGFSGSVEDFKAAKKRTDYIYEALPTQKKTNPQSWSKILANELNCLIEEKEFAKEVDLFNQYYLKKIELMPNVFETLNYLKSKGKKILLISNGWENQVNSILKKFSLINFFDKIYISESENFKKSELTIFIKAVEENNIIPSRCLMVGDRPDEDGYAKRIGMDYAWFRRKPHYIPVKEIELCDYILDDLLELEKFVN